MRIRPFVSGTCVLLAGLALLAWAEDSEAILIDDFSTVQNLNVVATSGFVDSQVSGSGILGGERDMLVTLDSGFFISMAAGGGTLTHMQIISSLGTGLIVWDGVDGDPALDHTGLGGLDFTRGGVVDKVRLPLLFNDPSAPITLTAYTDAANYSEATVLMAGGSPPDPQTTLTVFFSDFTDAGTSGGANFSNIGAFSLLIDGSSTQDLTAGFGIVNPEPSTATLLLLGIVMLVSIRGLRWAP